MEKRNNKGLLVLVALLSVAVLALGSFIAYDKLIASEKGPSTNENTQNNGDDNINDKTPNTNSENVDINLLIKPFNNPNFDNYKEEQAKLFNLIDYDKLSEALKTLVKEHGYTIRAYYKGAEKNKLEESSIDKIISILKNNKSIEAATGTQGFVGPYTSYHIEPTSGNSQKFSLVSSGADIKEPWIFVSFFGADAFFKVDSSTIVELDKIFE